MWNQDRAVEVVSSGWNWISFENKVSRFVDGSDLRYEKKRLRIPQLCTESNKYLRNMFLLYKMKIIFITCANC